VFIGVFAGLGRFDGDEPGFRSWVFTIAHRRLLDERRRLSRRPQVSSDEALASLAGGDVESDAATALGEGWVRQVCAQLPADQQTVILPPTSGSRVTSRMCMPSTPNNSSVRAHHDAPGPYVQ
jgi:RNA polymerase sigma-70 factor (ECF subfamily)